MPTYKIALSMLKWILFLINITTYIPFRLNFVSTVNFISNIIIIVIYQTKRMSLYGIFLLNHVTIILRDIVNMCYSDNIKTWMNNCACWNHYMLLHWLLVPIQNIIIIIIYQTKRMSLYGFFLLNRVTIILRDIVNICYSDNIKTWMNNCNTIQ